MKNVTYTAETGTGVMLREYPTLLDGENAHQWAIDRATEYTKRTGRPTRVRKDGKVVNLITATEVSK